MRTLLICLYCIFVFSKSESNADIDDNDIPIVEGVHVEEEDDVLVLNKFNFNEIVYTKQIILVEFYAPWCGHCKSLAPEYSKAAKILKEKSPAIPLGKVDATAETELAAKFEVSGYPTLFVFRKGEKFEYDGPRTAEGIVEYMEKEGDPDWKPPPEAVLMLRESDFEETVSNAELILVEFYAPWCGHCKRLAPEYERAARALKQERPPIPLAKIDGTAEKSIATKYNVSAWPTLKIFRKGKSFKYDGPREEAGIIAYMKDQAKLPSKEVTTAKQFQNMLSQTDITVVGFFDGPNDDFFHVYTHAGNDQRGKYIFLHTFSQEVSSHCKSKVGTVVLYQPQIFHSQYEGNKYIFNEQTDDFEEIVKFLREHAVPLVGQRTRQTQWKYENKFPIVAVYYDVNFGFEYKTQTQITRKEVLKAAKDYKGKVTFVISNEEDYGDELQDLDLDDSGEDVNVGYFASRRLRYRLEPQDYFDSDVLREFVEKVQNGQVQPYVRSQPIPKENKGPVLTVVAKTFQEIVTNTDKDVLLEFYAPWCGHCKKLEPIYRKLAKHFADNDNLAVAKIDATANDLPETFVDRIKGFPMIFYIKGSSKEQQEYLGDRSFNDLLKFVNEQLGNDEQLKDEL